MHHLQRESIFEFATAGTDDLDGIGRGHARAQFAEADDLRVPPSDSTTRRDAPALPQTARFSSTDSTLLGVQNARGHGRNLLVENDRCGTVLPDIKVIALARRIRRT